MVLQPKEPDNEVGRQARQQYLEQARKVVGEAELDYTTLYQRFAENDWAAIKLDDAIALSLLRTGHSPKAVAGILHQSPYLQHQVHANRVPLAPMSQYVRSTVMKAMQQVERSQLGMQQVQQPSRQHQSGFELDYLSD